MTYFIRFVKQSSEVTQSLVTDLECCNLSNKENFETPGNNRSLFFDEDSWDNNSFSVVMV